MGRTGFIEALEPVSATLTSESVDGIADLFVVSASFPDYASRAVAIMQGSSSRRMISPFALIPSAESAFPDVPLRALIADFDNDGDRDVGALAARYFDVGLPEGGPTGVAQYLFYGIPGKGDAGDLDASAVVHALLPADNGFEYGCATWAAGDLDADGVPEVVGIDGGLACAGQEASSAPDLLVGRIGGDGLITGVSPLAASDLRVVTRLELADLDADGDLDLLVLALGDIYVPGPLDGGGTGPIGGDAQGRGLAVLWNDGSGGFGSPTAIDLTGSFLVVDVTVVDLAPGQRPALAYLGDTGTVLVRPDPDASTGYLAGENVHWLGVPEGRLRAGDLDGDGLVDLAVGDGGHVYVLLGAPTPPLGGDPQGGGGIETF
jgi:hypothetical protein